ncbi:S-adenosyl-L-methionine-dependent methyltransferase [Polychaeton citri CBS 116435]|uniref:S-adenosyl-L-methionine-dependent methyltransferase n=1 Tax=Polychaeton citri CBS 116435 TaxID=1314669 RepID=A0A9P4UP59_9PEZI|nr:S-adenosyl-L-methionine-dependent methyltransferase [Polychaeton citri CBS 116435]
MEQGSAVPRLVHLANGVTLEVGPGSGVQFPRFDRDKISKIYGIEPNKHLCDLMSQKVIQQNNLDDIYTLINGSLEDSQLLELNGVTAGTIDSVVCMQVLCSVPDPARAAKLIYKLLKPGGQLLFWEHEAHRDRFTRVVQETANLLWSPLIGGCHLGRDIESAVVNAGQWDIAEFTRNEDRPFQLLPRVWGRFIKPEA